MTTENTDPPAPSGETGAPKTFTQEELDRIIADRLARAKAAPPADYAELQASARELADLKAAQLTETEKLSQRAEAAERKAQEAETRAREAAVRAAVVGAATRAGAVDADAVLALLDRSAVTVGDDGQVTGAEEAVKSLLEAKQYLVGATPSGPPAGGGSGDQGARKPSPSPVNVDGMSMADYIAARKAGTII